MGLNVDVAAFFQMKQISHPKRVLSYTDLSWVLFFLSSSSSSSPPSSLSSSSSFPSMTSGEEFNHSSYLRSPRGLAFTRWEFCELCSWHKQTELAHSFLFCPCVYFCLYGSFTCISIKKFSRQLSAFSLCSSCLVSALLVLSTTMYLFMKVSFSPDIILRGWLGLKHLLTN